MLLKLNKAWLIYSGGQSPKQWCNLLLLLLNWHSPCWSEVYISEWCFILCIPAAEIWTRNDMTGHSGWWSSAMPIQCWMQTCWDIWDCLNNLRSDKPVSRYHEVSLTSNGLKSSFLFLNSFPITTAMEFHGYPSLQDKPKYHCQIPDGGSIPFVVCDHSTPDATFGQDKTKIGCLNIR